MAATNSCSPRAQGGARPTWRLLDTGVRTGAENMALDDVLLRVRDRGASPNTVRFLQFSPPVALVGFHQRVDQEIRLDYCRETGIDVNRRITGGGAILFDEAQLGWELIARERDFTDRPGSQCFHRLVCQAAIEGLKELGIAAAFRPRNDIEVNGRKISGTGGIAEGSAFLFQGTLLLDFDVEAMLRALRVPVEKLKQASLNSAADRVTWVAKELGVVPPVEDIKAAIVRGFERVFHVELQPSGLLPEETRELEAALPKFRGDGWIQGKRTRPSAVALFHGFHRCPTGSIHAHVQVDAKRRRIRSALITGDFFISPRRTIFDLEAHLREVRMTEGAVRSAVEEFWQKAQPEAHGLGAEDIAAPLCAAIRQTEWVELGFDASEAERLCAVRGSPKEAFDHAPSLLLLPYCAKLPECKHRFKTDCPQCGDRTVGAGFDLGERYGLRTLTIVSFEHLMHVLDDARRDGVQAYFGCCCQAFYTKHYDEFHNRGIPGILVDIDSETCYDLGRARAAYAGRFEGQTHLDVRLLEKVLKASSSSP